MSGGAGIDKKAHWQRLSPLLDELLDLAPRQRAARLAALLELQPEIAAELEAMLAQDVALADGGFLDAPALPPTLTAALPDPLAPGQTMILSSPRATGLAPETVEIVRDADHLVVREAALTN